MYKRIFKKILKLLESVEYGSLKITDPDGKTYVFKGVKEGADAEIELYDYRALKDILLKGDIGFAKTYQEGLWESPDISSFLIFGIQNESSFGKLIYGGKIFQLFSKLLYFFRRNTEKGSRHNIHAHYDLGNEFYKLFLDESMTYSAALFDQGISCLKTGQEKKYERILNRIGDKAGSLLEIGCGWGGFANHALSKGGYDIKGITLSKEQHEYARNLLEGKAEIMLEDYRHQNGLYDYIVSIEMFEAVGEKYWPVYFQKIKDLLHQKGKAVVQTITIDHKYFQAYRTTGDMIRTYIFPGGMLPSFERFKMEAEKVNLKLTDSFSFGQDYAKTLQGWLNNFEDRIDEVKKLGFDEPFIRIWKFYLSFCIAAFQTERTDVMQLELVHAD
jgi:cyclopropane-fatty-acyl-phospholipid synthase